MLSQIKSFLDSDTVAIIFAVWTGIYLVQVVKGESGAPGISELWWIVAAFAVGVFIV